MHAFASPQDETEARLCRRESTALSSRESGHSSSSEIEVDVTKVSSKNSETSRLTRRTVLLAAFFVYQRPARFDGRRARDNYRAHFSLLNEPRDYTFNIFHRRSVYLSSLARNSLYLCIFEYRLSRSSTLPRSTVHLY